ncbi:hypothetical protein D3C76_1318940 [compost metagenome]
MGGHGIDIGGHHVRLDLIGVDQPFSALANRIDQAQQLPGLGPVAQAREGHAGPHRSVAVLPAVLAHTRYIPLDIARLERAIVEGRIQQLHNADIAAYQVTVHGAHGHTAALHRGGLG